MAINVLSFPSHTNLSLFNNHQNTIKVLSP